MAFVPPLGLTCMGNDAKWKLSCRGLIGLPSGHGALRFTAIPFGNAKDSEPFILFIQPLLKVVLTEFKVVHFSYNDSVVDIVNLWQVR
jgi:hypothetical protein